MTDKTVQMNLVINAVMNNVKAFDKFDSKISTLQQKLSKQINVGAGAGALTETINELKKAENSKKNFVKAINLPTKKESIDEYFKRINNTSKNATKSIFNFSRAMGALSILFASQIVMRQLMTLTTSAITFYQSLALGQTEASRGIIALSANWQYLKFTIGEAIGTMLLGFLPALIEIIQKIALFIQEHPKLAEFAFKFILIGSAIAWALAQLILLGSGIVNLVGAKSIVEVGTKFKAWGTSIWASAGPLLIILAIVAVMAGILKTQPKAWEQVTTEVGLYKNTIKGAFGSILQSVGLIGDVSDAWLWVVAVVSKFSSLALLAFANITYWAGVAMSALIGGIFSFFDFWRMAWNNGGALAKSILLKIAKWLNTILPEFLEINTDGIAESLEDSVSDSLRAKNDMERIWKEFGNNTYENAENVSALNKLANVSIADRVISYKAEKATQESPAATPATDGIPTIPATIGEQELIDVMSQVDLQVKSSEEVFKGMAATATERFKDMELSITETSLTVEGLGTTMATESEKNILPNLEKINTEETTLLDTVMLQSIAYQDLLTSMTTYLNNGVATELTTLVERIDKNNRLNETYNTQIKRLERIKELQTSSSGGFGSSFTSKTGANSYGG